MKSQSKETSNPSREFFDVIAFVLPYDIDYLLKRYNFTWKQDESNEHRVLLLLKVKILLSLGASDESMISARTLRILGSASPRISYESEQ